MIIKTERSDSVTLAHFRHFKLQTFLKWQSQISLTWPKGPGFSGLNITGEQGHSFAAVISPGPVGTAIAVLMTIIALTPAEV